MSAKIISRRGRWGKRTAGPSASSPVTKKVSSSAVVSHSSPKTGLDPISCHAVLERSACAPLIKERRMECINATSLRRKSGQWGTQRWLPVQKAGSSFIARFSLLIFLVCPGYVAAQQTASFAQVETLVQQG